MTQEKFLRKLVSRFAEAEVPYVVVGSVSSSIHGEPRFTRDIDVVIKVIEAQLDRLVNLFSTDCYVSESAAHEALRNKSMFNVIDYETGWKADLIILKPQPYDGEAFNRRVAKTFEGVEIYCQTPEDTILSKLRWAAITPSERQLKDAFDVARVCWDVLDFNYLAKWAPQLGVGDALEQLLQEAEKMLPDGPVP